VKLYVMRHGPAEDEAESRVDDDRALTSTGRERVRDVARALVEAGEEPSDVVTSPLVRAVQTAEVVALVTKLDDRHGTVRVLRDLSPGGESARLVRRICSEGRKRVMLVGHEPDLSELMATLVGSSFSRGFDKASVVGLHFSAETGRARLRFVLDPKSLTFDPPPSSSSP
jgi:phosphohistidine phosphatase